MATDTPTILEQIFEIRKKQPQICIDKLTCWLEKIEDLQNKKYSTIEGNDNFLDLIKYVDLTGYNRMYCGNCNKIQNVTAEGCKNLILFICDNCNEIVIELFKSE